MIKYLNFKSLTEIKIIMVSTSGLMVSILFLEVIHVILISNFHLIIF